MMHRHIQIQIQIHTHTLYIPLYVDLCPLPVRSPSNGNDISYPKAVPSDTVVCVSFKDPTLLRNNNKDQL